MKHRTRTKITIAIAAIALLPRLAHAQQDPQFTQYMFNMLALNPAYAGSAERVSLKGLSRHQWVGFAGAPVTQTLTVHSPVINESFALGGTIMRDEHGPDCEQGQPSNQAAVFSWQPQPVEHAAVMVVPSARVHKRATPATHREPLRFSRWYQRGLLHRARYPRWPH